MIFTEILAPKSSKDVDEHNLRFSRTWKVWSPLQSVELQTSKCSWKSSPFHYYYYHFSLNLALGIFENITFLCSRIRIKLARECISNFRCNAIYFTSWRMQTQLFQVCHYCLNSSLAYFVGNTLKHFLDFATKRAFEPYILLIVTEYQCWPSDQLSFSSVLHSPPVIYQTLLCT